MSQTYAVKLVYEGWATHEHRGEWIGFRATGSRLGLVDEIPIGALAVVYVCNGPSPGLAGIIKITGTWREGKERFKTALEQDDPEWSLVTPTELLVELPPGHYVPISVMGLAKLDAFRHATWVWVTEAQFLRAKSAIEGQLKSLAQ
jgi:predicted RNA-binding protein with PUA-like domain